MFGLKDEDIEVVKKAFVDNGLDLQKVFVFGSRVLGNYRNGSDVDLVYKDSNDDKNDEGNDNKDVNENISEKIRKTKNFLEEETLLPYKFDLLIYSEIENEELKKHIDEFGESIEDLMDSQELITEKNAKNDFVEWNKIKSKSINN
jgi:predicted nucleotidyltransferase